MVDRTLKAWLAAVVTLFLAVPASAFESGKGQAKAHLRGVEMTVFTYRPSDCHRPTLLFVFHGKGRKASNMRDNAIELAGRACLSVLAPLFDSERFPNWRYHRAGVLRKGDVQPEQHWTGTIVKELISWGRQWAGEPTMPYILFGHSAGAQFLSRLSAYAPLTDAERIVIANPSVYVLPSVDESVPYGFGDVVQPEEAEDRLRAYLTLPITIYLGDQDTSEKNLVKNAAARRQGLNRLERGLYVFRRAWDLAKQKGWRLNWRLATATGVGHSSKDMLRHLRAERALGLTDQRPSGHLERNFDSEHAG